MVSTPSLGYRRDSGLVALVLAFFAVGWFNWTPRVSGGPRVALLLGMAVSIAVAVVGALRASRTSPTDGALHDPATGRGDRRGVGVEFGVIGLGVLALGVSGAAAYIPVWVCAVVGVHFFPLAGVFGDPMARWAGGALAGTAIAALLVGLATDATPSSVTGPGAGLGLLLYATCMLLRPAPSLAP